MLFYKTSLDWIEPNFSWALLCCDWKYFFVLCFFLAFLLFPPRIYAYFIVRPVFFWGCLQEVDGPSYFADQVYHHIVVHILLITFYCVSYFADQVYCHTVVHILLIRFIVLSHWGWWSLIRTWSPLPLRSQPIISSLRDHSPSDFQIYLDIFLLW